MLTQQMMYEESMLLFLEHQVINIERKILFWKLYNPLNLMRR